MCPYGWINWNLPHFSVIVSSMPLQNDAVKIYCRYGVFLTIVDFKIRKLINVDFVLIFNKDIPKLVFLC